MSKPDLSPENTGDTVPFPAPQIFDVLPPLHALLLRLITSQTDSQLPATTIPDSGDAVPASTAAPTSNNNNNNNNNHLAPPPQNTTTPATQHPDPTSTNTSLKADLDTKSLITEASSVKIRIQKAKAALETLPDIERTVEEQNREIEELETKIERLKGVIGEFGRKSGSNGRDGGGFPGGSGRKLGEDVDMGMDCS